METRVATVTDAALLAALHGESFGAACWNTDQLAQSLKLETTQGLIALNRNVAQAFILCQVTDVDAEILTFCTAPLSRRMGIGNALLSFAIERARAKGARRMTLEVAADNNAALGLYHGAGFKHVGKRVGYYSHAGQIIDAVILARHL